MTTKPRLTPFDVIAGLILLSGGAILAARFALGLGATTRLSHDFPWGLWIGFDVMAGVALSAGGFTLSAAVHVFGMRRYAPLVRPAILTAFLGYALVVVGLFADLGRPWRLAYPLFVQAGTTSVLFEVAVCVALYLAVLFVESSPALLERLAEGGEARGLRRIVPWGRLRRLVGRLTVALTIVGLVLSTLHQSSLGALFLAMPTKLHPLWYSALLPVQFFVSAVVAGLSMVILEGTLSRRALAPADHLPAEPFDRLTLGLGKAGALALAACLATRLAGVAADGEWPLLATGWGALFLAELGVFVLLPAVLFTAGWLARRPGLVRGTALLAVTGVVFNRVVVCFVAFHHALPPERRYVPGWMEVWVSVALVTALVVAFRWLSARLPILSAHEDWTGIP